MTRSGFLLAMEEVLGVPPRTLRDTDTRDTIAQWSSFADADLFTMIATQLGIEPDGEMTEAETVGDLLGILERRGGFGSA